MIFGNKKQFAIECFLDETYSGVWMNGYICFYIKDKIIGHINDITSLRDVMYAMESIFNCKEMRICIELYSKNLIDIFNILYYSFDEESPYDFSKEEEYFFSEDSLYLIGAFLFFPNTDSFLDWSGYLVSSGEYDKIIYKKFNEKEVDYIIINRGYADNIMGEAIEFLKKTHGCVI